MRNDPKDRELDQLLQQVDELLAGNGDGWYDEALPQEPDFDPDEYAPRETREDDGMFYRNYSNQYGAQVRNYQNGYGSGEAPKRELSEPGIPAYNADFRAPRREKQPAPRPEEPQYADYGMEPEPEKPKKKRRGCGCTTVLAVFAAVVLVLVLAVSWLLQPPKSPESIGSRKRDTATVLICGTDADGTRTDTMMLLYLSGSEHKVGLLSLPRDTYTIATAGYAAKLNSAYGRNNGGEEGMEALLDYVADIIGYRPDGYVLLNMEAVPGIVDAMGGLEIEVPLSFTEGKVSLTVGLQDLTGKQVLALLRHRSSYAMADLTRVQVQRAVIKACLEQWVTLDHVDEVGKVLRLLEENTLSSLSTGNYLWMAKTVLLNMGKGFATETLPGHADYIDGGSFYILDRSEVAKLINESFNPYRVTISEEDLNIAG